MSVQLLSSAIKDGLAPDLDRKPEPTDERPGTFDSESFDKVFDAAYEQATSTPPLDAEIGGQIQHKGLDAHLKANTERVEAKETDAVEFKASRESRDELNERYGKHGDLPKTLSMFLGWADELKKSPAQTAAMMAESYARATPWALTDKVEKPAEDDPYGRKKLDNILSDAIDRAASDKKDFEGTKEQRAKLRELFPTLSFDEALKTIVKIDRDMHKDPLNTAGQVAAMFGMAVTPVGMAAQRDDLASQIDRVIPTLPNFDGDAVEKVLRHPKFQRTHDKIADLRRAHQVTLAVFRNGMTVDGALSQL